MLLCHCAARSLPHTVSTVSTVSTAPAMLGGAIVTTVLATQTVFEITLPWVALGTPLLSTRNPCTRQYGVGGEVAVVSGAGGEVSQSAILSQ